MADRTTGQTIPAIWGDGAIDVPLTPSAGVTYRKSTISAGDIANAWPYATVVDSSIHNEVIGRLTDLVRLMEEFGIIPWGAMTTYPIGSKVTGSDSEIYISISNGNINNDPISNPTKWILESIVVDGRKYSDFNAAVGATGIGKQLVISTSMNLVANVSTVGIDVKFSGLGKIVQTASYTLHIEDLVSKPNQIFDGFGVGEVTVGLATESVLPQWFGISANGTDEYTGIQSAITAAGIGGSVEFLPVSVSYGFGTSLIPLDDQVWFGHGELSKLFLVDSSDTHMISDYGAAADRVKIRNMKFDGNKAAQSSGYGMFITGNDWHIKNNKIVDTFAYGVYVKGGKRPTIEHNKFGDTGLDSIFLTAVDDGQAVDDALVLYNNIDGVNSNHGIGLRFKSPNIATLDAADYGFRNQIIGNVIKNVLGASGLAIEIWGAPQTIISKNQIDACLWGISVAVASDYSIVGENVIGNITEIGIELAAAQGTTTTGCLIRGNTLKDIGTVGIVVADGGISGGVEVVDSTIEGNSIDGTGSYGIQVNICPRIKILDNDIKNCADESIRLSGASHDSKINDNTIYGQSGGNTGHIHVTSADRTQVNNNKIVTNLDTFPIYLQNSENSQVEGNDVDGYSVDSAAATHSSRFEATVGCTFKNNKIRGVKTGANHYQIIQMTGACTQNIVEGNVTKDNDTTDFMLVTVDTITQNNVDLDLVSGTVIPSMPDSATPSVDGADKWLTGATTTITNFQSSEGEGIEKTIMSEHAITITDGTNIFLNGSGNFVMASTDSLTIVKKADGKWYEISRSDNT